MHAYILHTIVHSDTSHRGYLSIRLLPLTSALSLAWQDTSMSLIKPLRVRRSQNPGSYIYRFATLMYSRFDQICSSYMIIVCDCIQDILRQTEHLLSWSCWCLIPRRLSWRLGCCSSELKTIWWMNLTAPWRFSYAWFYFLVQKDVRSLEKPQVCWIFPQTWRTSSHPFPSIQVPYLVWSAEEPSRRKCGWTLFLLDIRQINIIQHEHNRRSVIW